MSAQRRYLATLCLMSGLALALAGQFCFAQRRQYPWDGAVLYGLAIALFLTAVRQVSPPQQPAKPRWSGVTGWVRRHPWRALGVAASVSATVAVGRAAAGEPSSAQGYALLVVWGLGVLAYLAAMTEHQDLWAWLSGLPARLQAGRWEAVAVLGLFVVAALARLTALDRIPYILTGDEASMGREAVAVLQGRLANPFVTGWFSHPTLFFYLQAVALRWLGDPVIGLRALPALAGALTVPAVYLLAREMFGRRVAFAASAFLAAYHLAVHYSRLGLNNAVDPLLAALGFYLLLVGLRTRCRWRVALAGVVLGLDQYFYMGSRVIPVVLIAWVAWLAWREPGFWRTHRGLLLVLGGGFLVAGWPLFVFFARHPADFMARANQLGILQSGWLAQEAMLTQRSAASLLWEQFLRAALAFHYYHDVSVFYRPGTALLGAVSAVAFTLGLAYSMAHLGERRHAVLVFWFWGVVVFGGMLLTSPPASHRLLLAAVPVSVFVALGLDRVAEVAARVRRWRPVAATIAVGLVVLGLGAANLRFYFAVYTPARSFADLNTEVAYAMGRYLQRLGPGYRYYFCGPPRMYAGFPSIGYLAPDVEGVDVMEPLAGSLAPVASDKRPVFVFLPERLGELDAVSLTYPAGELQEFRRPDGTLLFAVYQPSEMADGWEP